MKPDPRMTESEVRAWDLYAAMYQHSHPSRIADSVGAADWADEMIVQRRKRTHAAAPPLPVPGGRR